MKVSDRRVTHVHKDARDNITHISNPGMSWSPRSVAEAVQDIRLGLHTYHVQWPEKRTEIHVVNAQPPYLRTDRDNTIRNNLDELPTAVMKRSA